MKEGRLRGDKRENKIKRTQSSCNRRNSGEGRRILKLLQRKRINKQCDKRIKNTKNLTRFTIDLIATSSGHR